jgi:parvulin-like peptidyl-prolyl isomerase
MAEVAERSGAALERVEARMEDVDPLLAEALLSTPPGELAGPLHVGEQHILLQVHEKTAASLSDPEIEKLVERELPRRALEREVRNRVRWHERL